MKKVILLLLCFVLSVGLLGCKAEPGEPTGTAPVNMQQTAGTEPMEENELVILYTNDVHTACLRNDKEGEMGYAALAAYKAKLESEGKTVILVDGGDALQGDAVGLMSEGAYIVDIMNEMEYLLAVPGDRDFDFGADKLKELAENEAEFAYICCNFIDLRTNEPVFAPYQIVEYEDFNVGFVGITTPETLTKSLPAGFQDESGNEIYGFAQGNDGQDLYDCVQSAIDEALDAGADFVICVGHMGTEPGSYPWTSTNIIANTTGMTAFLDAHSHSVIQGEYVSNSDGDDVLLCSGGSRLVNFCEIRVDLNTGKAVSALVSGLTEDDEDLADFMAEFPATEKDQ